MFTGDVRIQSQQDKLHQYILNNLKPADKDLLTSKLENYDSLLDW